MEPGITNSDLKQVNRISALERQIEDAWHDLLKNSSFVSGIRSGDFDPRLFGIYLLETYQYTSHNARNQAIAGARTLDRDPSYLKFCFEHAAEETGHELMALHDFSALGFERESIDNLPAPLPATEILIAYLYWISFQGNTVQRLGYSYWAENCYRYINPLIKSVQSQLGLKDNQLTFFIAHGSIDVVHAREVVKVLDHHCKTDADWKAVERVMLTSLRLTGNMLEEVWNAFQDLRDAKPSPYTFLSLPVGSLVTSG